MELGETEKECEERYKDWVKGSVLEGEWELIRKAVQRGQLTGSNRFAEEVSKKIGRRIEFRGQGKAKEKRKINLSPFSTGWCYTFKDCKSGG